MDSQTGDGTIGVVFGFQSAKVFYIVLWNKAYPNAGFLLKVRYMSIKKIIKLNSFAVVVGHVIRWIYTFVFSILLYRR